EKPIKNTTFISRYAPNEPHKRADIFIEALKHQGVETVFAYPGGTFMEIHQALTRSSTICNVLPRHEQGGGFARSSGKPEICIATFGPCATNLVSGLANAMLDSVPLITITGQVPCGMIGAYAFQETPIVEEESMRLPGYMSRMPKPPKISHLEHIVRLVSESKKPVLYVSGGCLNSSRVPSSTRKKSA
ncbi:unnamed protein product, partial [Brassica oleracea]